MHHIKVNTEIKTVYNTKLMPDGTIIDLATGAPYAGYLPMNVEDILNSPDFELAPSAWTERDAWIEKWVIKPLLLYPLVIITTLGVSFFSTMWAIKSFGPAWLKSFVGM